ncbi:MAG: branched-chain amino acid transport system ATP-binding protein [Pseudonocardiales bacterium]|nr:branched-chain amino acid transport system ATP-binding protein [Pseudonocardiales bacterium]
MTAPAPATQTSRLSAENVVVRFGGVVACNDVSLSVPPDSIVGLIGPNGAGKTTLFSVLSGLRRPTSGRVYLDGNDVTKATPQSRVRQGLGRTFQHPEVFAEMSVREHLVVADRTREGTRRVWTDMVTGRGLRPKNPGEDERVGGLMDSLGLGGVANASVASLPLGMLRLVELGRALAAEPSVLLLDEPSSGLDTAETAHVVGMLRRTVAERGVSLLLVEHDVALVMDLCEYIYVLDFGSLIAQGKPDDIRRDPAVRAAYLGTETDDLPTDVQTLGDSTDKEFA